MIRTSHILSAFTCLLLTGVKWQLDAFPNNVVPLQILGYANFAAGAMIFVGGVFMCRESSADAARRERDWV